MMAAQPFTSMATYVYETIPKKAGEKPRRFEVEQRMSDAPLKTDPQTGLPVRRVILGGSGIVTHGASIFSMSRPKKR
jgi:predicted nucleic acid-binding Zn ribbon protein